MIKKLILSLIFIISLIFAQDISDKQIDRVLYQCYKMTNPTQIKSTKFHYECFSVGMFPTFAIVGVKPFLYGTKQCYKSCNCIYFKSIDRDSTTHLILAGLSYYNYNNEKDPSELTYRLFYLMKEKTIGDTTKWIMEKPMISVVFDKKSNNPVTYAPRISKNK